jgi:protein-disulfide isomerase
MRKVALPFALSLLFVCTVAAQTGPAKPSGKTAFDKATMEDYVRHLFVWGPQIQVKVADPKPAEIPGFKEVAVVASYQQATQSETFFVSNDGRKIVRGTVYDISKNPFQADAEKIKTDVQPSFGPADAPVTAVVYSDFQCTYCKEEAKAIRQNIPGAFPKEVRVYFKDFPLESIHPWAKTAAVAGRCIFRQQPDAFWAYHDWIFEHQADINPENLKAKVLEFAKPKGIEGTQLGACIDMRATEAEVNQSAAEARALGVNSTPTMFVNGRRLVGNVAWPQIKQIIEHEIEYKKTHAAAEKCCEVTIPSPLKP